MKSKWTKLYLLYYLYVFIIHSSSQLILIEKYYHAFGRYEQIITKIESKRDGLSSFDEDLRVLNVEKTELNDKMRGLERSLVELLVDQQKKLLSISSNDNKKKANI